ncbi:hypothetical protein [Kineococcus xinjiangensis]|nr:hypothetical protein [Kineococcus xinjiangensis]
MSSQSRAGSAHAATPPTSGGDAHHEHRALAPIRWPKPDKGVIASLAVFTLGLVIAILVPALVAPPDFEQTSLITGGTAEPAPEGADLTPAQIGIAMAATVLGALIMLVSAYALHRRTGSIGAAILAFVPTFVVVASGAIIATMLLLQ